MPFFKTKPITKECRQFDGSISSADELIAWAGEPGPIAKQYNPGGLLEGLLVRTREGGMLANPGDWVIKGLKGEFYPCKPEIFELTYERLAETPTQESA